MLIRTKNECVGPVIDAETGAEARWPKGRVVEIEDESLAQRFIDLGGAVAATEDDLKAQAEADAEHAEIAARLAGAQG